MTDEEIGKIWDANVPILNTENVLAFTRAIERHVGEQLGKESAMQQIAIEAKVREECKAEWQKGFDEGTIAGYESGQMDMREECAVICEEIDTDCHSEEVIAMTCAEAIRGRGKE